MENNVTPLKEGQKQMPVDPFAEIENKIKRIKTKLDAAISPKVISKRDGGGGKKLDYLEGWYVIARMNEIFGQGNWSYQTEEMRLVHAGPLEAFGKTTYTAHYVAKVTVRAFGTVFSDYGYGDGSDKTNLGKAHELAVKEAVTDGIKRSAKNYGMSMGLALYDKTREFVGDGESEIKSKTGTGNTQRAETDTPEGSKDLAVTADPAAPSDGTTQSGGSTSKTSLGSKAKNRDELNALITAAARVAISKKIFPDAAAVRTFMSTNYATDKKEALSDANAAEFLSRLEVMINGG